MPRRRQSAWTRVDEGHAVRFEALVQTQAVSQDGKTSEALANDLITLLLQFQTDHLGVSLAIARRPGWWWHRYGMLRVRRTQDGGPGVAP